MSFAIIETGGNQYRVEPGQSIRVEKLEAQEGDSVEFDKVLLRSSDNDLELGKPYIKGAKVEAKVKEQGREDKKIIFRYKPKKRHRRKQGHRQPYTEVEILRVE